MFRFSFLLMMSVLLAAQAAAQADAPVVRFDGIGLVQVGMTLAELNKVLHTSYTRPTDPDEQACTYLDVPKQPGIGLMILDGRVARVDVDDKTTQTAEGIRNGDSETHALQVYGKRLKIAPSAYAGREAHYLTVNSPNGKYGIRFETDSGKIIRYYAGTAEAIQYIEGCE